MKCRKGLKILFIIFCTVVALIVLFLPFIVEKVYYIQPPLDFFYINYDAKDILAYYGSILSFAGTVILGALTLHQNKKAQEKSDEVNRLQLELQRKSMAMAEAQYSKIQNENEVIPKFEISLISYNGNYAALKLTIKNVASIIVSRLTPLSVTATDVDGKEIANTKKMEIKQRSLSPAQSTTLVTDMPELIIRGERGIRYYPNVTLSFSFSCEDEKGNIHYFRASAVVPTTKEFYKDLWSIEKVG